MDSLGSSHPLESIALRFAGLGLLTVVNNLWTWVAVVAAAGFGFVRTRTWTSLPVLTAAPSGHKSKQTIGVGLGYNDGSVVAEPDPDPDPDAASSFSLSLSSSSLTKGNKFIIAYYEDECMCTRARDHNVYDNDDYDKAVENGVWWEKREKVWSTKSGQAGWYRCQDVAALDGSVVRLWNGVGGQGGRTSVRLQPAQSSIIRYYGC